MKSHPVQTVLERIEKATRDSRYYKTPIRLVAVSKTKSITDILSAYKMGVRDFGENRATELAEKAVTLKHLTDIKWHFIGHLQRRQSLPIAQYAHYFHAVDRIKIIKRLSSQLQRENRQLSVFLQVNISGESSKHGFNCAQWENNKTQQQALLEAIEQITALDNIRVLGLMTMAPWSATKETVRSLFKRLKHLSIWLNSNNPKLNAVELSMGMSGDFEIAIEEGATYVRVGSAIFGARD